MAYSNTVSLPKNQYVLYQRNGAALISPLPSKMVSTGSERHLNSTGSANLTVYTNLLPYNREDNTSPITALP
jgi:hypothetical protein